MTPTELRAHLVTLRWRAIDLAAEVGRDKRQVHRWLCEGHAIPEPVAQHVRKLAAFHTRNPPPAC